MLAIEGLPDEAWFGGQGADSDVDAFSPTPPNTPSIGSTCSCGNPIPIWDEPGYVSVTFFAAFTAQGVSTVRKKFASGKLKGRNFDGSVRILKSELRPDS
jgi:hypothetical protein